MQAIEVGGVFLAGIISFFSPCILPIIPVFISTLLGGVEDTVKTKRGLRIKPILRVSLFVLGLSTTFVLLGLAFGTVGAFFNSRGFLIACGIIVILFGIYQTGLIKIPFLMREKRLEAKSTGLLGAYLLGLTFSFGWTPCVGPILAAVLALTASQGGAWAGMFYMLIYSLGLLIPFLVFTVFSGALLGRIKGIYKHMKAIKIAGGIIIIIMGIFLITDSLYLFTMIGS